MSGRITFSASIPKRVPSFSSTIPVLASSFHLPTVKASMSSHRKERAAKMFDVEHLQDRSSRWHARA